MVVRKVMARITVVLAVTALVAGIAFIPAGITAQSNERYVRGQILVRFNNGVSAGRAAEVARSHSAKLGAEVAGTGVRILQVPAGKEEAVVAALSHNPNVEFAELDNIAQALTTDTYFGRQYGLENTGQSFTNTAGTSIIAAGKVDADIDAPEAWTKATGQGVAVAVLDSGVDLDHEDISGKVALRANFTSDQASGDDIYGHGTHVSGIIAASSDNGVGVSGVCPGCTILSGKVLDDNGSGATSWIANGITWAADNNAKVINMSLGMMRSSRTLETAVNNAWNRGVVIVAAAGNNGTTAKVYPGAYANVIAVAATTNQDQRATFSTYGVKWVDIAAPGENVYGTFPNHPFVIQSLYGRSNGYDVANGTSMASPVVAAVAGLVWSQNPTWTASQVRGRVLATADPIAGTGKLWANGRVNAANALGYVQ